ncbi:hypothetical protein B484DRAFT_455623 [Ochromonadaceae sp. CCMP2298]|nr:hypothetical protein B484DRAFT_455623 [Ochromonadaceae sp. CCMP2298]|mmetsp:Transcript_34050/g.75043  ORF Transcript_34050/g.75043 Transcript_34050/m.75043 type:complete len:536 (-) Transcript_34050:178-1785(-)
MKGRVVASPATASLWTLPSEVLVSLLSQWIALPDLMKLDKALKLDTDRAVFRRLLRDDGFLLPERRHLEWQSFSILRWMWQRRVACEAFQLTRRINDDFALLLSYLNECGASLRCLDAGCERLLLSASRLRQVLGRCPNLCVLVNVDLADLTEAGMRLVRKCGVRKLGIKSLSGTLLRRQIVAAMVGVQGGAWNAGGVGSVGDGVGVGDSLLEELSIDLLDASVSEEDVIAIAQSCPRLRSLHLSGALTASALRALARCCPLSYLSARAEGWVDTELALLAACPLEEFRVQLHTCTITPVALDALTLCPLRVLELHGCGALGPQSLRSIARNCRSLWELDLGGTYDSLSEEQALLDILGNNPLRRVDLSETCTSRVGTAVISALGGCSELREVRLQDVPLCDESVGAFARGCPHLHTLVLNRESDAHPQALTDAAFVSLSPCPLHTLGLAGLTVGEEGLIALARCPLREVDLSRGGVTERGVLALADCQSLVRVQLWGLYLSSLAIEKVMDRVGGNLERECGGEREVQVQGISWH